MGLLLRQQTPVADIAIIAARVISPLKLFIYFEMGLSIFLLARCIQQHRREAVTRINQELKAADLPLHDEPQASLFEDIYLPEIEWRYSKSECLEFIAAKFIEDPSWIPPTNREDYRVISTISLQKIFQSRRSHIVCLPKNVGYYVPVDFKLSLLDRSFGLGSSLAFRDELKELAIKLNLNLGDYTPHFERLRIEREQGLKEDPFGQEKWILLCLYNLATASINYGSAIVFAG